MKNNYQVCLKCCNLLGLGVNSLITSQCGRKYCDICGWNSFDDLSMISKPLVDDKLNELRKTNPEYFPKE